MVESFGVAHSPTLMRFARIRMNWFKNRSRNKYNAKPTDGYPSKLEAAVGALLELRQKAGEISDIKRQQTVVLQDGPRSVKISWRVDFSYVDNQTREVWYCEAKGLRSREYLLKLKMWRANPPANLEIYEGSYKRPTLVERIEKKGG